MQMKLIDVRLPSSAPGYWPNEQSGVLRPAIEAYLIASEMTGEQIAAMRAYLRQWICHPIWDTNPHGTGNELAGLRDLIDSLTSRAQIDRWLEKAIEIGIDPL
jgi:hypothetical protein